MNAWIPALSTAFQHSIQNLFFFSLFLFKYSSVWKYMASVHCHIHYYSPTFFSFVQVYASELVNSISVFLSAAAKMDAAAQLQRDKREGG